MRILLVPPNDWLCHPLSSRVHYIFERLAQNHQVHVMNFRIGRFGGEQVRSTKTRLHNATLIPANDISAFYVLNAPYHYKIMNEIISNNSIDVIVNANILASSIACVVSRRANKPVVYDYLDHFPDSASIYYKNPAVKALVKNVVESFVKKNLAYSDKVVVLSKTLERMMLNKYHMNQNRLSLIPNGVDLDVFKPRKRNDSLKKIKRLDLKNHLILLFLGSLESRFDLVTPILAVKRLAADGVKLKLLIVGPELSKYYSYLKNRFSKLACVEFVGYVDSEMVPFYISAADICLAPYKIMQMNFNLTLKLLEYLASEKIVLMTDLPDAHKVFGKNVVFYSNLKDLRTKILDVQKNKKQYSLRAKASSEVISHYSWDAIARSYEKLLESLVVSR